MKPIDLVLSKFEHKRKTRDGWLVRSPLRRDTDPSLSIAEGTDGRVLMHDFGGGDTAAILAEIGLREADLFPPKANGHARPALQRDMKKAAQIFPTAEAALGAYPFGKPTTCWNYTKADGEILGIVARWNTGTVTEPGKTIRPVSRVDGGWTLEHMPAPRPLLYLPDIVAKPGEMLVVSEGEGKATLFRAFRYLATTSAGGAQAAKMSAWSCCNGRVVIIFIDHDAAGERYGQTVARLAYAAGALNVKIVRLAKWWRHCPEGGDIINYVDERREEGVTDDDIRKQLDSFIADAEVIPAPSQSIAATTEATTPAPKSEGFNLTDLGNAERLVARHGRDLRHCAAWDEWLVWTGTRWRADTTGAVERRAKNTIREMYREAAACTDSKERDALIDHARRSESESRINAMIALAASEPTIAIAPEDLDRDPWLFNCKRGVIDLRTGELRAHDPADLITKISPVEYDPSAECPRWLAFLERIFAADAALISYAQRVFGYSLTGDIREQILPVFHGDGANGKSTMLDAIAYVMGEYAGNAPPELLMVRQGNEHPTEIAGLQGLRLIIASESERGRRLKLAFIKRITGDTKLVGRFMRMDFFEFDRTFKTVLVTNNKPIIDEDTEAAWRRLKLVPFSVVIPEEERDAELGTKLKAEASGILRWLVAGCLDWQRHGLGEPEAVTHATGAYRGESDQLGAFLSDCCLVAPNAWAKASKLRTAYEGWCKERGFVPLVGNDFTEALRRHGAERDKRHAGHGYLGVGLLAPVEGGIHENA